MIERSWFDDTANLKNHYARRSGDYGPIVDEAAKLHSYVRSLTTQIQDAKAKRNEIAKEFGDRKKGGHPTDDLTAETSLLKTLIPELESELRSATETFEALWASLPNVPEGNVPLGDGEDDNVFVMERPGVTPDGTILDHVTIGEAMGLMSFERGATLSGSRFVVLSGALAKLERAITNLMIRNAENAGYVEHSVPHLVRRETMFGTGQLPKFEEDLFATNEHFLIPTAEVPLTNLMRGRLDPEGQTIRMFAHTPCYRAEAGSAGRDTRGLMRMHQFNKVELVTVCEYKHWWSEFNHMVDTATRVLEDLDLRHRVIQLCTGDLGFSAAKTYDIEVWVPSEDRFREISSVSWCGTFQAVRMDARYRSAELKRPQAYQTLNGSGLAVGRTLLAVMENYQTDGGVVIPLALRDDMGGSFIDDSGMII